MPNPICLARIFTKNYVFSMESCRQDCSRSGAAHAADARTGGERAGRDPGRLRASGAGRVAGGVGRAGADRHRDGGPGVGGAPGRVPSDVVVVVTGFLAPPPLGSRWHIFFS